jgi:hypothetical protein
MVVANHNFAYGLFGVHNFINFILPFTPSIQLTYSVHDGFMKQYDDQWMFFHTTFWIFHTIFILLAPKIY